MCTLGRLEGGREGALEESVRLQKVSISLEQNCRGCNSECNSALTLISGEA
jgi:hypothetical protein